MPYVPDPNDVTRPNDNDFVGQSAPTEIRSMKGKILSEVAYIEDAEDSNRTAWVTELEDFEQTMGELIQAAVEEFGELIDLHIDDRSDPHELTAEQVGLENVNNFGVVTSYSGIASLPSDKLETTYVTSKVIKELKDLIDVASGKIDDILADNETEGAKISTAYDVIKTANDTYREVFPPLANSSQKYARDLALQGTYFPGTTQTAVEHILSYQHSLALMSYNGFNAITYPFLSPKHNYTVEDSLATSVGGYTWITGSDVRQYSQSENNSLAARYTSGEGRVYSTKKGWGIATTSYIFRNVNTNALVPPRDSLVKGIFRLFSLNNNNSTGQVGFLNSARITVLPPNPL